MSTRAPVWPLTPQVSLAVIIIFFEGEGKKLGNKDGV